MFQKVLYDRKTFGITQLSLKMLRDTLAERINREISVLEIPTNDICSGFLILDHDEKAAIFTGDGFRTDNCDEGGAGCRAALALFGIYGIDVHAWDMVELWSGGTIRQQLLEIANQFAEDCVRTVVPKDCEPDYIDHCI